MYLTCIIINCIKYISIFEIYYDWYELYVDTAILQWTFDDCGWHIIIGYGVNIGPYICIVSYNNNNNIIYIT